MKPTTSASPGRSMPNANNEGNGAVYKHSNLTRKIIGCAMEVHKALGCGFQEVIYQRALAIEMDLQNIAYKREFEMPFTTKEFI